MLIGVGLCVAIVAVMSRRLTTGNVLVLLLLLQSLVAADAAGALPQIR